MNEKKKFKDWRKKRAVSKDVRRKKRDRKGWMESAKADNITE